MAENSRGQNRDQNSGMSGRSDDLSNENKMNEHENASANRGGTADMNDESRGTSGTISNAGKGSGMRPKSNVTGSDYDGQVSQD
jgi:hypothetical protein